MAYIEKYDVTDRYQVWYPGGDVAYDSTVKTPGYATGLQEQYALGSNNPDWKDDITKGNDASTDYRLYEAETESAETAWATSDWYYNDSLEARSRLSTNRVPQVFFEDYDDPVVRDIALKRIKDAVSNNSANIKILVPLKEWKETAGLIGSLAQTTLKMVKSVAALKKGKFSDLRKASSEAWLQYNFAVSPTIGDIAAGAEAVADALNRVPATIRVQGTASRDWLSSDKKTLVPGWPSGCSCFGLVSSHHQISYRFIAGFRQSVEYYNDYQGLAKHLGLGIGDVVPSAWELLPWSWLVDYFTTAGDFLDDVFSTSQGNTTYVLLNKRYIIESQKSTYFDYTVDPGATGYHPSNLKQSGFMTESREVYFRRQVLGSLPTRALRLKCSDEIAKDAVTKLLNLVSILGS